MKYFIQTSLMFLGIFSMAMTVESMTLPLVKGNHWVYSYFRYDTSFITSTPWDSSQGVRKTAKRDGVLSFTIDSVKTISGLNDTVYFQLGIIDSGTVKDTVVSKYKKLYSKDFRFYNDTLFTLDTNNSPGFNSSLLFFQKIFFYKDIGYQENTDTSTMMLWGNNVDVFSRIAHGGCFYPGHTSQQRLDIYDTVQWIPEIGTVLYSNKNYWKNTGMPSGMSSYFFSYALTSFNGTSIPAIAKPVLQLRSVAHIINHKKVAIHKQIFLTGNEVIEQTTNSMYYSLRGQKVYGKNGSQMLIINKTIFSKR